MRNYNLQIVNAALVAASVASQVVRPLLYKFKPLDQSEATDYKLGDLRNQVVGIPKSLLSATQYAGENMYRAAINNTCGIMIIAPLIVLYAFCQRFLVQGIERSGLTAD